MNLEKALEEMTRRRGDTYRPRTRHLDDQGKPVYTNRLFLESSPYLLQHAHNPVNWYPWGDEAFSTAERLDRPVLLSVGYATCHWCHVMEEESFEDEEIARYINANYIPVKVDREERPDVDSVYLSAVQAITGHGGWPMTVWLTPEGDPFYGGTYFPARDGDRGTPMGFFTILQKIRGSYDHRKESVSRSAAQLKQAVRQMLTPVSATRLPGKDAIDRAIASCKQRFDRVNGGITGAPKFPSSLPIRLLLRQSFRTGDAESREMAALTLEKMAGGGIFDQVGGGFHRYATDDRWLVPHFEKMLYDNALLVPAYIDGWKASGNENYRRVAEKTLDYVAREMTAPGGAFFSATDADSLTPSGHRKEGWFFTWTMAELQSALGEEDAHIAATVYGASAEGNFEARNVLFLPKPTEELADDLGRKPDRLVSDMDRINRVLYATRKKRPHPLVDDKILVAWNGLMISAFAQAGFAMKRPQHLEKAAQAAGFILEKMADGGRLKRSFKDGIAAGNGFLDDYAYLIAALLDLFETTAAPHWLDHAVELNEKLTDRFADHENGGYFMTAMDHERLIAREKPIVDGALPSANAVALRNLLRLSLLTADTAYLDQAQKGLAAVSVAVETSPLAFGEMILAIDDFFHPASQVIVVKPLDAGDDLLTDLVRTAHWPGGLVMIVTEKEALHLAERLPLFRGKTITQGKTTAYVCRNGSCQLPVTDAEALMETVAVSPKRGV